MADTTQQATAPGLEAKAQLLFEIPYAELSPKFQGFIRIQVTKDAAVDMLEALKELLEREWQDDDGSPTLETARGKAKAAIAKAEGC